MDPSLADELGLLASSLGMGELPPSVVSEENRGLQERLAQAQIRHARIRADCEKENDELDKLHSHVESVQSASASAKHFIQARTEEVQGERNLEKIFKMGAERARREGDDAGGNLEVTAQQLETLEEEVEGRSVVLELMEEEHSTDVARMREWARDADEFEAHARRILGCARDDEIRIKEMHLRMEKVKSRQDRQKRDLDESSTENKMAQLALDKTAEDFRRLHEERQGAVERWEEAASVVRSRDQQLQELMERITDAKSRLRKKELQLGEESSFLSNERGNVGELESVIRDAEDRSRRLGREAEAREAELEAEESRVVLEERETMKAGADVAQGRARLKELKALRARLRSRVEVLQRTKGEAEEKRRHLEGSATTAEEKVMELEALLEKETKKRDGLQWDLDRLRDQKFKKEQELKALRREESATSVTLKGLRIERTNLGSRIKGKKDELSKKEDVAVTLDYRLSQLERELKELKGQTSKENRAEVKRELERVREELSARGADKRSLDHLCHKMEADVRKAAREVARLEEEERELESKLEEVTLVSETSKRHHARRAEEVEALLLEEKLLMVNEKKAREDLKAQGEMSTELDRRRLEEEGQASGRRREAESHLESWRTRQRHLAEDLRFVRAEARDRREQRGKLEAKYEVLSKSLGGGKGGEEEQSKDHASTHAIHLVRLAQEKAELSEEAEELRRRLKREEEELVGMKVAAAAIRNSNDKFRSSVAGEASRAEEEETEEVKRLREKVKEKADSLERLRNELDAVEADIASTEVALNRNLQELELTQGAYDDRCEELASVERDLQDQEKKLLRAEKARSIAARTLKQLTAASSGAGPSSEEYERDMDLRAEKEAQRAALIRLREIAIADVNFSAACRAEMESLGLSAPILSRMEMQHVQQRATSSSNSNYRRSASLPRRRTPNVSFYRPGGDLGTASTTATTAQTASASTAGKRQRSSSGSSSSASSTSRAAVAHARSAAAASSSMLVMELSQVDEVGRSQRGQTKIRARLPPVR